MNDFIARINRGGIDKLALLFPAGALKGAGAALAAAMNEGGFLVRPDSAGAVGGGSVVAHWRFENLIQEGEGALLLGPDFAGRSIDEAEGVMEGMPLLLATARALAALVAEGALPRGIVSSGILVALPGAGEEAVLVLPPTAVARALSARGPDARSKAVARLASPLATGAEADASFLLAQAAYRYATGKNAFEREAAEPGSAAGSARYSAAAALAAPRLDPALASLVDLALADPNGVPLSSWVASLEAAAASGWEHELSAADEAESSRRRAAYEAVSLKKRARADFFRKRGGILIAIAVALAAIAFVAGDMIRAQRDKPDFSALPPLELVGRYYAAIEGLDLDSLEACGDKKALKADWNLVMNLSVVTKTRMAYEGRNPVLHAKDWIAAGEPALSETDFLYGIVGMSVVGEAAPSPALKYRASYSFWSLDRKEDPSGDPSKSSSFPREEKRADELLLERAEKGGWRIVGLERKVLP
jgi:hypothetical protein